MNIREEKLDGGIRTLVFDRADSVANVFDRATMQELGEHIDRLASEGGVKGLILLSAKPSIFIAGADIKELLDSEAAEGTVREAVRGGQEIFNRLVSLPFPTVAAIHGAALGGGCEIALACDYRVASDDKATRIGLPETALGILPAWGGCTRLPRLIGLRKALDVILAGKRLAAGQAKKYGLVDEVVPRESLTDFAIKLIGKGRAAPRKFTLENNPLAAMVIGRIAGKGVMAKTHGHYPAVPRALEVVLAGLRTSVAQSLKNEEDAIVELARTEVCHNLVRVFFLQERSKGFRYPLPDGVEPDKRPVNRVAVIGAGVMGAGIAQWAAGRGQQVILRDIGSEQLAKGMASIAKVFQDAAKRRVFTRTEARQGMDRVAPSTAALPMRHVDLVLEAAVERLDIKKKLFQDLAAQTGEDTILATNTSALSISEIAEGVPHPERVVGIHYFNPVHRMQLVEVVVGSNTAPRVVDRAVRFVQKSGKLPVVVKDSPGFVVNRILMPYLGEAGHLFANGANPRELDQAMLDFGMPMGPMRLMDEVGVDVCSHVARHQAEQFGDRMPLPDILQKMLDAGEHGRKTKRGFYIYTHEGKGEPPVNDKVLAMVSSRSCATLVRSELERRMVLLMVNEAARCLQEDLVAAPEDIDFAMIFGTGFAPFRGGPLRYADSAGIPSIVNELNLLAQAGESRFVPCERLQEMASTGQTFYS